MEQNAYPWSGCGSNKEIAGCRFTLSVMAETFATKILNTLDKIDTSHVWKKTDLLSTTYRGHKRNVINTLKSLFTVINDGKTHITLEATLSKGCPGDTEADIPMELTPVSIDTECNDFDVHAKIAFYPLGKVDYMDHIAYVVNLAIDNGLYEKSSHYATELHGNIHKLFNYFHEIFDYADEHIDHFVYQITLSINSPSRRRD